jgi:uncharacterized cupredoxin-like copper-binding protein
MDMKKLLWALLTIASCTGTAALAHGDAHPTVKKKSFNAAEVEEKAFGREGDPRKVTQVIKLSMGDEMRFLPAEVVVKRGVTVRFQLHNAGKSLHEMVLGTPDELKAHAELMKKFPEMEHSEAHMAHVKPGANGEIIWQFTKAGTYQFACLMPGHFEAGMVGQVTVK